MTNETVLPVTLIPEIKQALIKLGHATETTPDNMIQDIYHRYVTVYRTSPLEVPTIPYGIAFLPKSIRIILSGDDNSGATLTDFWVAYGGNPDFNNFNKYTLSAILTGVPEGTKLKNPSYYCTLQQGFTAEFIEHTWYFTFDPEQIADGTQFQIFFYENGQIEQASPVITYYKPSEPSNPLSQYESLKHHDNAYTMTDPVNASSHYLFLNQVDNADLQIRHNSVYTPEVVLGEMSFISTATYQTDMEYLAMVLTGGGNADHLTNPISQYLDPATQQAKSLGIYLSNKDDYGTAGVMRILNGTNVVDTVDFGTEFAGQLGRGRTTFDFLGACDEATGLWDLEIKVFNEDTPTTVYATVSMQNLDLGTPVGTSKINLAISTISVPGLGTSTGGEGRNLSIFGRM